MPDPKTARLLSGEIMTGARPGRRGRHAPQAVVDAEFETVKPGGTGQSDITAAADAPAVAPVAPPPQQRRAVPEPARRAGPLFWAAGLCLVLAAFWTSGGHALLLQKPADAGPEPRPVSAVRIGSVTTQVVAAGGPPGLLVSGEMINDGAEAAAVPPLSILVTAGDGEQIRHGVGASGAQLGAGATSRFSQRLHLPKNGVTAVAVTVAR